jgi:hypothetical protein
MEQIVCNLCNTSITNKKDLTKHQRTKKCKDMSQLMTLKNNTYTNQITEYKLEISRLLENNIILKKEIEDKNKQIKLLQEKASTTKNNIKIKDNKDDVFSSNDNEHMFQIDINLNNKQLNKTKYKDVSEDVIKKEIQSLKLKDNYQLEYRDEDGYINITNLCKAGGKKFNHWNSNDKTKRFLQVLSLEAGIPVTSLIKIGSGHKIGNTNISETWAHPQVAINIAQWISPEFDVLVSKWVYEIMLTGKIDIRDNKTTQELDIMNKENKLLKNRIKLLESKVLQKQPREVYEENKNVVYVVTTDVKEANGHYKIGKAQDLQKRMSVYNTTDKHEVIYSTSCKTKKNMDILETVVHNRLEDKRVEPNKEWFLSEDDAEDLIKVIEECKKVVNC